jgi:hypothetical protein
VSGLWAKLELSLPESIPADRATAVLCFGASFHTDQRIARLEIAVDGIRHPVAAFGMPRMDMFRAHDAYRSGFWGVVPVGPHGGPGEIVIRLEATLADGTVESEPIGAIAADEVSPPPSYAVERPGGTPLIAISMATFEPVPDLFRAQIDSIRAQSDPDWICVVSDDASRPERFAEIETVLDGDSRFILSRSDRRLGFYRNFERALGMVPGDAELVALCDQDDRWFPEKLATLRASLGEAELVYSDQRLVDRNGRVLAETLWRGRRNNHTNLSSLMVANSVTGAAALFRRRLLDHALPFPEVPGWQFHDHWLAVVALSTGNLAYVDRPLYDYVQHQGAILGQVMVESPADSDAVPRRRCSPRAWLRGAAGGWRSAYFCAYLRIQVQAQTILSRCPDRLAPGKRRALVRLANADSSPLAFTWLAARPIRALAGRNETLGAEGQLARGILWRALAALSRAFGKRPGRLRLDASFPACGPDAFSQKRLRRWRGRS